MDLAAANQPEIPRRFGQRATINQPAQLAVGDHVVLGVIRNVGLRGVFFAAARPPKIGTSGTLWGPEGRAIPVRVVWKTSAPVAGVGLEFAS